MNSTISVRKAVVVARILITCIAVITITAMIFIIYLVDAYSFPLYLGIPAAMIFPLAFLIAGFHAAGIRWVQWAFLGVADVQELFQALQLSGFFGYPPAILEKNHPHQFNAIMNRLSEYRFIDDGDVATETIIFKRRPYQSGCTVYFSLIAVFIMSLVYQSPTSSDEPAFILTTILLACGFLAFAYYSFKPKSVVCILSETGIQHRGEFYSWDDMRSYQIWITKTPAILIESDQKTKRLPISSLYISHVRLNHLLHVYYQRHKLRQVA